MNAHPARVVIGIPTHDSERFIAETLSSARAQTHEPLSIVISDDASTDATLALARAVAGADPRVRIVAQPRRLGWIGNCNALLEHADGEYFCWLPHDDRIEPHYVAAMVGLLERRPDAVLAYSGAVMTCAGTGAEHAWPGVGYMDRPGSAWRRGLRYLFWSEWVKGWPFHGLLRTRAVRTTGGLRPVEFASDNLLLFHLSLLGGFAEDPRSLCHKRLHRGSVSTGYGHRLREWDEYLAEHHRIIRAVRLPIHGAALLHAAVALRRTRQLLFRPLGIVRRHVLRRGPARAGRR